MVARPEGIKQPAGYHDTKQKHRRKQLDGTRWFDHVVLHPYGASGIVRFYYTTQRCAVGHLHHTIRDTDAA